MEVNYFAPLHLINVFSKNLIKNSNSAIVNVISIGGLYPSPVYMYLFSFKGGSIFFDSSY